jgi:hypothetical protein
MPNISIVDSVDVPRQYGVEHEYLRVRLSKALSLIDPHQFSVPAVVSKRAAASDIARIANRDTEYLAVILGKGHEDLAKQLALAANARKDELTALIRTIFSAQAGAAGATWGRLSIVPALRLSSFPDDIGSNKRFLSNLLLHEVGHAISGPGRATQDHSSGGVMKPALDTADEELTYGTQFIRDVRRHLGRD